MAEQHSKYTKNHCSAYFKMMNSVLHDVHLNKKKVIRKEKPSTCKTKISSLVGGLIHSV